MTAESKPAHVERMGSVARAAIDGKCEREQKIRVAVVVSDTGRASYSSRHFYRVRG
jgi:hypothetical protein